MEEPRVPVYIINGFLESGKTSFIDYTLKQEYFQNGEKTLVILCEEGEKELDLKEVAKINGVVAVIDEPGKFTADALEALEKEHHPNRVLIEYNGVWKMEDLFSCDLPAGWQIFQVITTVDASTFGMYTANNNMKAMFIAMVTPADLVIFNRVNSETPVSTYRRSVKVVNSRATVVFENEDGEVENVAEELPYDLNADPIKIEDYDFGIFFVDAQDHPENYEGKNVEFVGQVMKNKLLLSDVFVPGRKAQTCCAADIQFIGYMCHSKFAKQLKTGDWVRVRAKIKIEFVRQYRGKGPVLYADWVEKCDPPKEELIYF